MGDWNAYEWSTLLIAIMAVGQTLFAALYLSFPWWSSFLGRSLFTKAMLFAVMLNVLVMTRIWEWPFEVEVLLVMYGLLATGIWGQLFAYILVSLETKEEQNEKFGEKGPPHV